MEVLVDLMWVEVDGEVTGSRRPLGPCSVLKAGGPAEVINNYIISV